MADFKGKYAVVTGGSQGLGAAVARVLAERGAAGIVTCGRNTEKGERVAREIAEATGCEMRFTQADLSDVEACRKVIATADAAFGAVDILVNAAALTDRGNILDTSPELFDAMIAVNMRAPFFLMQEAAKIMRRQGTGGAIVNIASMSSLAGQPFIAAYCASKGGLATLTKNTAYGLMRDRIRVNGLNIGWMASDGEDRIQKEYHGAAENWLEEAAARQPFGRLIAPEEVARAVAFLAGPDSGLMTGSMVNFDQSIWGAYDDPPTPDAAL
ncbi:SDR family oxidoreductase [Pseudoponticoccus marisrubri]|uniref:Short-chain dehydrogenase n=1 Tax=Pseudoponticoccus marisrubri TaxID=1685382 RepID=A0A0W7WNM4_9RHOB|nr:SDR family oxidoreductase [Pseudoponticoccus marisrubri]KUF12129.1 short-chain dehydrogenase [Pseudoponticoccus marisrubri]